MPHLVHVDLRDLHDHVACPYLQAARAHPTRSYTRHNRASPEHAGALGLRSRPFPDGTASLLPSLLAATRTGLPPASDDELTNTKKHHGATSRCHLPVLLGARKRLTE